MDLKSLFDDLVPEEQPPSEVDVGAAMRAGRGLRRRRRALAILTPVAAAAVTALVLASGTLAGPGRRDPAATVTPSPIPSASASKPRPAAEVWPAAVTTIPAKSADGSTYAPVTALNATELLLRVHKPASDKPIRLEVYDTVQRTARVLGEVPEPGGAVQQVEAGPGHIAWWVVSGSESVDLWTMPRSGGTATQVARLKMKSAFMERIAVLQDRIIWSVRNGGLHSIPITGGTPQALPGTEGLHLQSWPWASDIGHHGFHDKVSQTVLMNVETGERISLQAPPDATEMRCSASWCVARVDRRYVTWRRGGSEPQPIDGHFWPEMEIRADRFLRGGPTIYDLATGQKAGIGWTTPQGSTGFRDFGGLVISWEAPRCGAPGAIPCRSGEEPELAVLNLAAVP